MDHVSAKRVSEGTTRRIKFGSDVECGDDVGSSDEQLPHAEQTASESEPLFRRNFIAGGRHLTRIRLQPAISFCLHRGSLPENTTQRQPRFRSNPCAKISGKNLYVTQNRAVVLQLRKAARRHDSRRSPLGGQRNADYFFFLSGMTASPMHSHFPLRSIQVSTQPKERLNCFPSLSLPFSVDVPTTVARLGP
jgi:hypothetical protein